MRRGSRVHGGTAMFAGLALATSAAHAEVWRIIGGQMKGANPIAGFIEATPSSGPGEPPDVLVVETFGIVGKRSYTQADPIEYQGAEPIAQPASHIHFVGDRIDRFTLRAGGEMVPGFRNEVAFRFLEFGADDGRVISRDPETRLPRRMAVTGKLREVTEYYSLPTVGCTPPGTSTPPPLQTPPSSGGSAGGAIVIGSGSGGKIEGALVTTGSTLLLTPVHLAYNSSFASHPLSVASVEAPTLEELGVRAPAGADVTLSDLGELVIASTGDLFIEDLFPAVSIPGLTRVTLKTSARIVVTGRIELPPDVSLSIESREAILDGPIGNGPIVAPPACERLSFVRRTTRKLGKFSLVASTANPMNIDVRLAQKRKRIRPGTDQLMQIVVYGSRNFDVHDIDGESRRLGRGNAESLYPGRVFAPMNRDGYRDLVTLFRVRDAEIAFGDREVCLFARTLDGHPLEGCDEIDTRPAMASPRRAWPAR
ncbi:MAG TPA: hypothetical protein VFY49_20115 [Myxococcota bacterium]|nr:hypothetical protein [Myxococcota bacterium]